MSVNLSHDQIFQLTVTLAQLFRPKYTMGGMELHDDPKMNEPSVHMRVLRVLLPMFTPTLQSSLENTISESIQNELKVSSTCNQG
jgi:hypothetical protein